MSVRVMSAVWALALPDSEKIVLLALADCANDEGHCWPGMKSLIAKCSKGERTIQGAIQKLVDAGHLTRREVHGKGCNYTVHPRSDCAPAAIAPRSDGGTPPQPSRDTPAAAAGKPSKNHQKPSYLKSLNLPEGIPVDPWKAFVRSRKAIPKVPFTEDAARGAARKTLKLVSEGYDAEKLLWKAVDQGWRTVFPHDDCRPIVPSNSNRPMTDDELRSAIRYRRDIGDEAKAQEYENELKQRLAA